MIDNDFEEIEIENEEQEVILLPMGMDFVGEERKSLRKIPIFGDITEKSFEKFCTALLILENEGTEPIELVINSIGGHLYHTLAIIDLIEQSKCKFIAKAYGQCMSGASLIFQAADERYMSKNCLMMIHYGTRVISGTTESQLENWFLTTKDLRKRIVDIYSKRIVKAKGKKVKLVSVRKQISEMLKTDSTFTVNQAIKVGLADKIIK